MSMDRRTVLGAAAATALASGTKATARKSVSFPAGFLWGAATAGHQVEGNNISSDLCTAQHVKPTLFREPSGDALNSLELWPVDALIKGGLPATTGASS